MNAALTALVIFVTTVIRRIFRRPSPKVLRELSVGDIYTDDHSKTWRVMSVHPLSYRREETGNDV